MTAADRTEDTAADPGRPLLRVLSGNPDDAEVAALTAVVAALAASAGGAADTGPRNDWGRLDEGFHRPRSFSPSSFRNVEYY
ncbi:hypothetical protein CSPHI_09640 [Corynebacterium sphenisci DSM 44792]|uniref:Acyl-CoA carboxylase subunit epsilon n=1 Tax=Corynebacterium sphenisci DSM 44792 TaxID=1437874 RepID=A0A1L7CZB3_9CORY|nr:acyl-CoA carboxylase epsilon subunit [Corynebacterium sphenisci]APT91225.1 hypothetical protein CSPHI_09640 [Corynebacterium sphenisci DSM 44792]